MMSLRQRLLSGGRAYGPMVMSDSPIVAEILSFVEGYDHLIFDHEHSPTDIRSGLAMLHAMGARVGRSTTDGPEPIVRVHGPNDPIYTKKVLDTLPLPAGILVPMVDDATMAYNVVQSTRYPATSSGGGGGGIRGCAVPGIRASGFGKLSVEQYQKQCQEDLLVMVQVESQTAIENISEIASVDGVDAIFLGPFDLSASLGKMGQFDDPEFQSVLKQAEQSILDSPNCLLAGFRAPNRSIQDMFERGYSLVAGSVDISLLQEAARTDAQEGQDAINAAAAVNR